MLNAVVKDALSQNRQLLPTNCRVREGALSETSGAYSEARKRLPLKVVEHDASPVSESFVQHTPSWFGDRRGSNIDGTTMTLGHTSKLRTTYPAAANQHGETVSPLMLLLVAYKVQSGAALPPEQGAVYGDGNTSEAELAARLARRQLRMPKSHFKAMRRKPNCLKKQGLRRPVCPGCCHQKIVKQIPIFLSPPVWKCFCMK